jgi:hypothetical protein
MSSLHPKLERWQTLSERFPAVKSNSNEEQSKLRVPDLGQERFGAATLAADDLMPCEQRRALDARGVRDAATAACFPRPWACSGFWAAQSGLRRASHPPDRA